MEPVSVIRAVLTIRKTHRERYESVEDWSVRLMWCSRGCLGPHATSVACLWHVSVVGGARRRGCAAGGVSVIFNRLLGEARQQPGEFVSLGCRERCEQLRLGGVDGGVHPFEGCAAVRCERHDVAAAVLLVALAREVAAGLELVGD